MARRNRKKKRVDGFVFPAPFAGLMISISLFALAYVWLGCRCDVLGKDIKKLEKEKETITRKYLNEEYKWMRAKSPRQIEQALKNKGFEMTWPRNDQIVRMNDVNLLRDQLAETTDNTLLYAGTEKVVMNERQ